MKVLLVVLFINLEKMRFISFYIDVQKIAVSRIDNSANDYEQSSKYSKILKNNQRKFDHLSNLLKYFKVQYLGFLLKFSFI